jgi:hypothetical protein
MIMLITCLRDPKCGPLRLVIDFSELIGAELDHTPKREIVPGGMLYKCENLQKFWSLGSICFKGPNRVIQHRFQTAISAGST